MSAGPNVSAGAEEDWKNVALMLHQTFCETLGDTDWDSYNETEMSYMPMKVGYALFGSPEDDSHGYSENKMKEIKRICRTIVEQDYHILCERNSEIWMAIIFVVLVKDQGNKQVEVVMEPVFRVPQYSSKNLESTVFIDRNCRIYKNWKDYLQNNTLPACSYCYPRNGVYRLNIYNEVEVEFGKTPASKLTSKLCRGLDQLSPCLIGCNIGVSAVGAVVPVSAPIVAASSLSTGVLSVYGVGRDIRHLVDRKRHQESIGLKNKESRDCWISLAGNIAGVLSIGIAKMFLKAARSGRTLTETEKVLFASFNVSTSAITGANIGNDIWNVIKKMKTNEVTSQDVVHLILSAMFFGHSVFNAYLALKVIKSEVPNPSIRSDIFKKVFYGPKRNSKIIRSFAYFGDKTESFLSTGIITNPTITLTVNKFVSQFKNVILLAAKNFLSFISSRCKQSLWNFANLLSSNQTLDNELCHRNQNLKEVVHNIGGHIWKQFKDLGLMNIPFLIEIAEKICNDLNNEIGRNICKVVNMIYMFIKNVADDLEKMYQGQLHNQKMLLGTSFSQSSFDERYKISGDRSVYFCTVGLQAVNLVTDIYNILKEACCKSINEAFNEPERAHLPKALKEQIPWTFTDSNLKAQVSNEEALQIARSLTKENLNSENCIVAYAESDILIVIEDDSVNLNVVKLKCCVENQVIVATAAC